jgi:hypothetical protein
VNKYEKQANNKLKVKGERSKDARPGCWEAMEFGIGKAIWHSA